MTLYMIGIGLWDELDISLKGLEAVKKCSKVFLESYTSRLDAPVCQLELLYGLKVLIADRHLVENEAEEKLLQPAVDGNVAFLVIGDVFGATTHTDLLLRAREAGVKVVIINNASVLNAVGITGLELYKFGRTTSIPFDNNNVETPYNVLKENKERGLHTLLLLDIKAEQERFMSVNDAINYLLLVEARRSEKVFCSESPCVGIARLGSENPRIVFGTAIEVSKLDFGIPPHSLAVPGRLHFIEEEALTQWKNI